jgi:hypothetical protein
VKTGSTVNLLYLFSLCLKNYVQGVSPQFLIPKYESDEIFENISFIQIEFSNLVNYLTIVCQSGQGTIIIRISQVFDT